MLGSPEELASPPALCFANWQCVGHYSWLYVPSSPDGVLPRLLEREGFVLNVVAAFYTKGVKGNKHGMYTKS